MRPLPPSLAKIAFTELNETPERIQQDLIILRVWISQQSHLRARTTDEFLIAFLRRCRFSLEETKKRIDNFFTYYQLFPEVLGNRFVNERIFDINRSGIHYYPELPKCDNQTAILIARFGRYNPKKNLLREILTYTTMAMEIIAMENDNAAVAGICEIVDLDGVLFDDMRQFDNNLFKKWWEWVIDCCPLKVKQIFVINTPKEMLRMMSIMRALMPCQMEFPVIMLKSVEELYEYLPQKCLPEEYGGCNGHIAECLTYMEDLLKSYRKYFEEDGNYGTIEELRSGDVVTYEAEFGANGSFRKLEVD